MNALALALQAAVGAGALAAGLGIVFARRAAYAALPWAPASRAARAFVGGALTLGGALVLASIAQPFFAFFGAVVIALVLLVALVRTVLRGPAAGAIATGGMLAAAVSVGVLQPLGLRVLSLPKADALPYEPVAGARVLETFPPGTRLESVRVAPDGTLFMTANRGEDWTTGDKSHVVAQVLARSADGAQRVVFELPPATTAGVLAFGGDGTLYMTSDGAVRGVWRIAKDGKAAVVAELPEGAWPNGICASPDGALFVADARRGAVWRVDPRTGVAAVAREDAALAARRFVALAPAANGVHVVGRDLFVTVSDSAQVLAFALEKDGSLGAPRVVARGIPGDDFAVDEGGALYVTTHPYDTLVRVRRDGARAIVADARQGVIGATDAAFGVLPGDTQTLYVVTDGGAFSSGDARAAGTLLALTLPSPTSAR